MEKISIFTALRQKMAHWASGYRRDFAAVASQRNDDHHFDEAGIVVNGLLYLTIGITMGFGLWYHYNIFSTTGAGAVVAIVASLLLFLVCEILKIVFGKYFLEAVLNGMAFTMPITNLALTAAFGTLTIGAFCWSVHISTKATADLTLAMKTAEIRKTTLFSAPAEVVEIDKQLAAVETTAEKARRSTWRGRPTTEGLRLMDETEKTKQALLASRAAAMEAARAEHQSTLAGGDKMAVMSATTLASFGGYAEAVAAILLVILTLLKIKCYEMNKKKSQGSQGQNIPLQSAGAQLQGADPFSQNSIDTRSPIGFRFPEPTPPPPVLKQAETVVATGFQPVSGSETKVITHIEVRDDIEREVSEQIRKIQRYFYKWALRNKGGGRPETIVHNLEQSFRTIALLQAEGQISEALKAKVGEYETRFINIKNNRT